MILDRLHLYENSITPNEFAIIELLEKLIRTYNGYTDPKYLKNIHKEILIILSKYVSSFTTIKPSNIINKKPYIIGEENQDKRLPPKVKQTVLTRLFSIFK